MENRNLKEITKKQYDDAKDRLVTLEGYIKGFQGEDIGSTEYNITMEKIKQAKDIIAQFEKENPAQGTDGRIKTEGAPKGDIFSRIFRQQFNSDYWQMPQRDTVKVKSTEETKGGDVFSEMFRSQWSEAGRQSEKQDKRDIFEKSLYFSPIELNQIQLLRSKFSSEQPYTFFVPNGDKNDRYDFRTMKVESFRKEDDYCIVITVECVYNGDKIARPTTLTFHYPDKERSYSRDYTKPPTSLDFDIGNGNLRTDWSRRIMRDLYPEKQKETVDKEAEIA